MKTCPDTTRLLDHVQGALDPEVEAHLHTCPTCRFDARILRELPEAVAARDIVVPEALMARTLAEIGRLAAPAYPRSVLASPVPRLVAASVLATITCAFALLITGLASVGSPTDLLLFCSLVGLCGGLLDILLFPVLPDLPPGGLAGSTG